MKKKLYGVKKQRYNIIVEFIMAIAIPAKTADISLKTFGEEWKY